tara:strand:+ start:31 stop:300 length:270 start_codon:yes stop_codon:yes gene_type:complete
MKKNSAFMLRSGNKPSIAKLMGASPIKDEDVQGDKGNEAIKEDKESTPDETQNLSDMEYVMKLGYGPRKRPVGPVAKSYAEASGGSGKK